MNNRKKLRCITFRVTADQYKDIENIAKQNGDLTNSWARNKILEEAKKGIFVNGKERVLIEQIARLSYLVEHGLGMLYCKDKSADEAWMKRVRDSKNVASQLANMILDQHS